MTQTEVARALGVGQPRLNDLLRGKIDKFSLDWPPAAAKLLPFVVQISDRFLGKFCPFSVDTVLSCNAAGVWNLSG